MKISTHVPGAARSLWTQLLLLFCAAPLLAQPGDSLPPVRDRADVEVASLGLNSASDDFAPVPLRGGDELVFTSSRSGLFSEEGNQRVWMAPRSGASWGLPTTSGEALSRAEHVGAATLTPDGNTMIFAAYRWEDDSLEGLGRTDLYEAERVRGEWRNVRNLGEPVNGEEWDSQPALSADGRVLYFASDRPGGMGGTDIWVSFKTSTGWSKPVNVGAPINTAADEMAPTVSPDGKALFFSSNGHGGVGGFDLFIAPIQDIRASRFSRIENLGTPINSEANEYFFAALPNSRNSLFSSDRTGNQDIYTAFPNPFPPEALVTVGGNVRDATSKTPVAATITVTDLSSGEVVANYRTDDRSGEYYVVLARGRRYSITAEAPDYIFYSDEYSVSPKAEAKDVRKDIDLQRVHGGTTRLLVFFDYDKAELKNESKPDLNRGIEFLKDFPDIRVEIAGHTDSVGSDAYNSDLSRQRAESVRNYLIQGGIDASRIAAKGYGESQPIADNGTEEGRARNRRVEMRVVTGNEGTEGTRRR